jgi:spore coat polysaccharide biosynthesis protein SpsF
MSNTVAIIQARVGSSRLPNKAMLDIGGKPMLMRVVERVRQCKTVDSVVVAIPDTDENGVLAEYCGQRDIDLWRGPELDVLDRYYGAGVAYDADQVVRVTSDCPLIEPHVIDAVVRMYLDDKELEYACNNLKATWPHGLDCEVFSMAALKKTHNEALPVSWREGVSDVFRKQPRKYRLGNLECPEDYSQYRLTVDWQEDLDLVREIYQALGPFPLMSKVLWLIDHRPELGELMRTTRMRWKFLHGEGDASSDSLRQSA